MSAQRCDELRLTGSGGANRVMEAEFKRLVMRSPFEIRVEKPKREGEATLLYPFEARAAWVAACYHRTSSRITWDLCSSDAVRLEPLFADLVPVLSADERLPAENLRFSVEVGSASDFEASPLQLRGVVKNALVEAFAARGVAAEVDAESPEIVFVVRRAGTPEKRHTSIGIDIGGGARHRRGTRVAMDPAPLRETMAAQLIMLSRWDARSEPLIDPMAGGGTIPIEAAGLAVGAAAIRKPTDLPIGCLTAFEDLPIQTPDLFPGTVPRILALDVDPERIPAMVGNLRAAGLTGPAFDRSLVIADQDIRLLTPEYVHRMLPASREMNPGVFCFNPPYGVRMAAGDEKKLLALYSDMGRVLSRFSGWRAACFVANPRFEEMFGHSPVMTKPATNAELRGNFLVYEFR